MFTIIRTVQRFYTGSNKYFRKAIEDVGGFPTDTITEDFELGVRMNAAGYGYSAKVRIQFSNVWKSVIHKAHALGTWRYSQ